LVLIDESGLLMAPLVRRSLAPKGQTPLLLHKAKHREKVSLIAALTLSPKRQRLGLYFSSLINDSYDGWTVAWFLRALLKHLRGPVMVVWDRGPMHRGPEIRQLQEDCPRLQLEYLPAYAPELNPVEQVWRFLKWNRLCNYAPHDCYDLERTAAHELQASRHDPCRLRSFWKASDLSWPDALAS
jgi:DDE superfamily endonuclease